MKTNLLNCVKHYLIVFSFLFIYINHANAQPVINSFNPLSGPIGSTVTISGKNFSATAADNIVFFGRVKAKVISATAVALQVSVPYGAAYQPLSVAVNGLTAYSNLPFTVTFKGSHKINAQSFAGKVNFSNNNYISSIAAADLDGDGKTDVAAINPQDNSIAIFNNTGHPGVAKLQSYEILIADKHPSSIIITDVTGDGKPDIIITEDSLQKIAVYRNMGSPGYFIIEDKVEFSTGIYAANIAAGDINGDGKTDLLVTGSQDQHVAIFKNTASNNNISFASALSFATGIFSYGIAIQDINADGKPDMILGNQNSNAVSVFENTGTSQTLSFAAKKDFATSGRPYAIITGDINGDRKADIITANLDSGISVLKNNASANTISFAPRFDIHFNTAINNAAITDLDGDGKPDIAVSSNIASLIAIKNTTSAGALSFGNPVHYTLSGSPNSVLTADLDRDGKPDIVAGLSKSVSVLRSINDPGIISFNPVKGISETPVTIRGYSFTTTKNVSFGGNSALSFVVNSDTVITAKVAYGTSGNIIVTTNDGADTANGFIYISKPVITSVTPLSGPLGTKVTITGKNFNPSTDSNIVYFGPVKADLLSAGKTYIKAVVPAGSSYQPVSLTCNDMTAFYRLPFIVTFPGAKNEFGPGDFINKGEFSTGHYPLDLSVADIDGDGKPDVITANSTDNNISVLRNTSDSTVSFAKRKDYPLAFFPKNMVTADFNGDGKPDVAVTSSDEWESTLAVFKNISTPGIISLKSGGNYSIGYEVFAYDIAAGDLDGDGRPDLVMSSQSSMVVFRNTSINGNISFAPPINIGSFVFGVKVCIADIDGDSKADIVATDNYGYVYAFRNTGNDGIISFAPQIKFKTGFSPGYIKMGDLDGDGLPEMTIANGGNNNISVYRNTSTAGIISFDARINYSVPPGPVSIADLDGDGKPELAVISNSRFAVLKNACLKGTIVFKAPVYYNATRAIYDMAAGDINGDGRPELIGAESADGTGINVLSNEIKQGFAPGIADTKITKESLNNPYSIQVTPNPVKDKLLIINPGAIPISTVSILNAAGAIVYEKKLQEADTFIPVNQLPAGVYFLNIVSAGSSTTIRFIKE